jgi:hypothetical protein
VVEGNRPETVKSGPDGSLHLLATNCEIYGNEIKIEPKQRCLGWWNGPEDRAVWSLEVSRPGRFSVWLDYACDDFSRGQAFVLEVGDLRLQGRVASTGGWESYRQVQIGEIRLDPGLHRLVFRSAGPVRPRTVLLDLRGILLKPIPRD